MPPQEPTLVVNIETGDAVYMHSVDASEAINLGDYKPANPQDVPPQDRANAMNRLRSVNVNPHPEMQSKEQRDATRKAANEEAAAAQAPAEPHGVRQALGVQTPPPATAATSSTEASRTAGHRGRGE